MFSSNLCSRSPWCSENSECMTSVLRSHRNITLFQFICLLLNFFLYLLVKMNQFLYQILFRQILSDFANVIFVCLGSFIRNVFSPCPLLPLLLVSIIPMVSVWIMDRMGDEPNLFVILMTIKKSFTKSVNNGQNGWRTQSVHYSDEKKNHLLRVLITGVG